MNSQAGDNRIFVGRNREMSELRGAFDGVLSGRGRLVMLAGEPGIGKTRATQELAAYVESQGLPVLWGRCHEEQGTPPYWPWVQLIRSYVQQHSEAELGSQMGPGAACIAGIVPEVRVRIPDLGPLPSLEPEQARFRFFDAVSTFLKRVSQTQPMVLVLEDLHWADQPSLLLLEFLSAELLEAPLLVVGTYRDVELNPGHPLSHSLGELARHQFYRELLLQSLSSQDVQQFIAATARIEPPQGLVKTVYLTTEGNPLFMTQIVDLLVYQGGLSSERMSTAQDWSIEIPQSVRMVIRRGLARHVSNIFTKTRVSNRAEEATNASRHGLIQ